MLGFKIEDKQITVAISDTFNLGGEDKDSRMFDKIYNGTITIDGVVKNIST